MKFKNRHEAGKRLGKRLGRYKKRRDVIVLGIPRGGVEVAFEVAKALKAKLSVVVTKKIGHPFEPEFAIGAVSPGNRIINEEYEKKAGKEYLERTFKELNLEISNKYKLFVGKRPAIKNEIVIIVDDGLATGYTMLAAIKYIKSQNPKKVVVAVPVAAQESYEKVKKEVDEVICLYFPPFFASVGMFFDDFSQVEDEDVKAYIEECKISRN